MVFKYTEFQHGVLMNMILDIFKSGANPHSAALDLPNIIDLLITAIDKQEFNTTTQLGELTIPSVQDPVDEINEPFPLLYRNWLRYFSNKICEVVIPRNGEYEEWYGEEEYTQIYNWGNIRKILQFYRNDFSKYLDAIRSSRMSLVELDQQFQLDLGENPTTRTVTERILMEKLFAKRYLELPVVYWYDEEENTFEEAYIARGQPYWSYMVQDNVFPEPLPEHDYLIAGIFGVTETPDNQELSSLKEKVKSALKVVQTTIDEKAVGSLDEGTYLEIMNQLKVVYEHCS